MRLAKLNIHGKKKEGSMKGLYTLKIRFCVILQNESYQAKLLQRTTADV